MPYSRFMVHHQYLSGAALSPQGYIPLALRPNGSLPTGIGGGDFLSFHYHASWRTRIVWLLDPARFAYVRQAAIVTRTPSGPPSDDLGGSRLLVGYSEVRESGRGLYRRRIFYLRDTDRYFDPLGAYRYGAPVEAVDPMTVSAGKS
jgi:hypothetical protein